MKLIYAFQFKTANYSQIIIRSIFLLVNSISVGLQQANILQLTLISHETTCYKQVNDHISNVISGKQTNKTGKEPTSKTVQGVALKAKQGKAILDEGEPASIKKEEKEHVSGYLSHYGR